MTRRRAGRRRTRARRVLAAAVGALALASCRRSLENPADPQSPLFGGEIVQVAVGPDVRGSIGDTLLFEGIFRGDSSRVAEYAWDFDGDGALDARSAGGAIARHIFASPGEFHARFSVRGVIGDVDSAELLVTVTDQAPAGSIGPDTVVAPGETLVTVPRLTDDGTVVRYEWDLDGDGRIDRTEASPVGVPSVFPSEGGGSVRLRATDEDGRSSSFGRGVRVCPFPEIGLAPYPPDGARFLPLRLVLRWSEPKGCAGPFLYDVYFDVNNPPLRLVRLRSPVPEHDPGLLVHNQTYYWRVVAHDAGGRSKEGPVYSFRPRPVPVGMVYFPPGLATVGSSMRPEEKPLHLAYLDGYYLDRVEVTRDDFALFVAATGYVPQGAPTNPDGGTGLLPVTGVTWADAAAFAAWRDKRLPSEAQWEGAARSFRPQRWPWGNIDPLRRVCDFANCLARSGDPCEGGPVAVGSHPLGRTRDGVDDLAGNVAEWVSDWFDVNAYSDPFSTVLPEGPVAGTHKIVRGGSWRSPLYECLGSRRVPAPPDTLSDWIGFRCLAPIGAPPSAFDSVGSGRP